MSSHTTSPTGPKAGARPLDPRPRRHATYLGFLLHRVSGVALALFLPLHFWALSQALLGEAALDRFLSWTHNPLAKASETVLVFLLAVHLAGGLRVLALEFLGWRRRQKMLVSGAVGFAIFFACLFLLNAV